MKIRNGFVSNSSSSSFILIGICIDGEKYTEEDMEKMKNETGLDWIRSQSDDESLYIGQILGDDDNGFDTPGIFEMANIATEIVEKLNKTDIPFLKNHIKLHSIIQEY